MIFIIVEVLDLPCKKVTWVKFFLNRASKSKSGRLLKKIEFYNFY